MKNRENSGKPRNLCGFECISSDILLDPFSREFVNSSQASQCAYLNKLESLKSLKTTPFTARLSHKQKAKTFLSFAIGFFSPKTAFGHCFGGFNIYKYYIFKVRNFVHTTDLLEKQYVISLFLFFTLFWEWSV